MTMWFHRTAIGRILRRHPGAMVRMVATATIVALWTLVGTAWLVGAWRDTQAMTSGITVELHWSPSTSDSTLRAAARSLRAMPAWHTVEIRHADAVWADLVRDLDLDGDVLRDVADVPDVIRLRPRPPYGTVRWMTLLTDVIEQRYRDVDTVVWSTSYVEAVERRSTDIVVLGAAAAVLTLLLLFVVAGYTFRSNLHRAGDDLAIGALVGATPRFLAVPHMVIAWLAGATGLALAGATVATLWTLYGPELPWTWRLLPTDIWIAVAVLAAGGVLAGWLQALLAVRHAMRKAGVDVAP